MRYLNALSICPIDPSLPAKPRMPFANTTVSKTSSSDTRGVTFHEDASRIRCAPGIFARLRSLACNILRFHQSDTIARDRYAAALGGIKVLNNIKCFK
jgi:hypothetical protein